MSLYVRWLQEQVHLAKAEVVNHSKIEPIASVDVSLLLVNWLSSLENLGSVYQSMVFITGVSYRYTDVFKRGLITELLLVVSV